ncbi:MAG: YibE/F family protein [Candidatus Magasanikbacteria bacterium]|nr:YibE/F family protein [Candidatus Magasanikbacteria bacterium]
MYRKIISLVYLFVLFSVFGYPAQAQTTALPGSVSEAIETDDSFSFPVEYVEGAEAGEPIEVKDEFYQAKITKVITETEQHGYGEGETILVQELEVEILSGAEKGLVVTLVNEVLIQDTPGWKLEVGDRIVVGKSIIADEVQHYISDKYRLNALWVVLSIFILITLLLTKFHGLRAFAGLMVSFGVIGWYIVPQIIQGANPLLVSLIGTSVIAATSLYIAHGFHARTSIALLATIISISIALALSYFFVTFTHLFGMGSEEAFYLQFAPGAVINLRGLLLGGIIIGVLGILDDITTAQAAVVEQIYHANPELNARELYQRASVVGREHILSLVNTLVLAYTGASLPLILLFTIYERPAWVTLNSEIILEEVIRMIIGSITLIIAVPIVTLIAVNYYSKRKPPIPSSKTVGHQHVH